MSAESGDAVVVIPTYNERDNLERLVPELLALDPRLSLIVVDDNSPDGTGKVADTLESRFPGLVHVIHRPHKAGIGPAYRAGFAHALETGAALIGQMDADRSHAATDLARLIAGTMAADVVLGSRYVPGGATIGWPWPRRLISRLGGFYARAVLGVDIRDLTGGFKVFRREALAALEPESITSDGYVFQIETTYRALRRGFRVVELPITFSDRVAGKSKLSRRIVAEAIVHVWRLRFDRRVARGGPRI